MKRFWLIGLVALGLGSCTTGKPTLEYTLARAAMQAAKDVEAPRLATGYYHRGMESYSRGQVLFERRDYEEAKLLFIKARFDFERSENSAHAQRKKSGEVL